LQISHVKAHRSKQQKQQLDRMQQQHTRGNECADAWAKRGASCDRGWGRELALHAAAEKVHWVLDYLASAQTWPANRGAWDDVSSDAAKPPSRGQLVVGPQTPHSFVEHDDGRWACQACGKQAASRARATRLSWHPCPGTVLKAAVAEAEPAGGPLQGHALYRMGPLHFCRRCGYYAEHRSIGLERPCTGRPAKNYGPRLALLLEGRHPLTGQPVREPRVQVSAEAAALWKEQAGRASRR
jgi:hypothetical protein